MSTITVRVEDKTKAEANGIFKKVGLDMSTAVNIFLRQVIRVNGLPFEVSADFSEVPNETTIKALQDADKGKMAKFHSLDELMSDLND